MASKVTRSATAIWLVGGTDEFFKVSKLPSRGEVLRVLFHYHKDKRMSLKDSIFKTTELLLAIWEKARIPTKALAHVVEHIRKLHSEWQGLKKLINRTSEKNKFIQQKFQERLDDLFDVAHRDAMTLMKIEEDCKFLEAQREKGRRGTMAGVDQNLTVKENRAMKRKSAAAKHALQVQATTTAASTMAASDDKYFSDSSSTECKDLPYVSEFGSSSSLPSTSQLRGTVAVVTPEVSAALDRTNISNRKAGHLFSALASTNQLNHNVEELIISYSAIRRARMKHREDFANEVMATFGPTVPLILHWDGKIMDDFTGPGRERVDRLPILVSGKDVVKILAVPKLCNGKAATMIEEIVQTINEWGLQKSIKGLCFDTTTSNTGSTGGVCIKLEAELDRELLNLVCRHHISEIMLGQVFSLHDVSKSPNIKIFTHFRNIWPGIDKTNFSTAMEDDSTAAEIISWKDEIIEFAVTQLEKFQPRDDYQELLELTIVFLGGIPPRGINFRYPGAIRRARWMARAIYSIKMRLFRTQVPLKERQGESRGQAYSKRVWDHLKEVCLFVTAIYVRYWFQSPSSTAAPRNDLALLQALSVYPNKVIAKAAATAFGRHQWYLSEVLVGFSFFDEEVTAEVKRNMVLALREKDGSEDPPKRVPSIRDPTIKQLQDFVTKSTGRFFKILGLQEEFLELDPTEWQENEAYIRGKEIASTVKVVNDLAEHGVALIQEFNSSITRNEEQKQFLLQVVEDHRSSFPVATKKGAIKRAKQQ